MASTPSSPPQTIEYSERSLTRAKRSLSCSPFKFALFAAMLTRSIPLADLVGTQGSEAQYTQHPLAELAAENALLWLIQVGVLRREVDGQGITDRFRLTPLGRQIIQQWQAQNQQIPPASWRDRIYNTLTRWLAFWGIKP
ncbi:hypothetical protein H6G20_24275 [Desertifilum sp. FACHB-1129]|uniref:Uncharacterized protein n=1 Tax=Desertifilum tharense IPPAS B-1220 TaxID=1781255 RepID=A0A1E5QH07_9CYAN|nr:MULTISPECIES: Npun_F0494 family protein [Desertifilum]MDA0211942.1 hypothetical protein [Cyanobacteria bacterium FC1]MBD2314790.1 hypothetical protein [Desertifilum sp. FACHB-1129]MBD2325101.1 hypothetical protein [Desertifilum sp. FACHB-866]MBD2335204.1 hypothetical protein [Desertifilum sp. FACHB-868]OEJ73939.1 hypothetical protein BH720_17750 [Desertifilum tharense IPPAS B-1220]